ncbi:MAG: hypothetical protein EOO97_00080 [Pedobacter sp.]|nr:MAG: hypothetical protein EOO97_00080 [Pedobacter sp.]
MEKLLVTVKDEKARPLLDNLESLGHLGLERYDEPIPGMISFAELVEQAKQQQHQIRFNVESWLTSQIEGATVYTVNIIPIPQLILWISARTGAITIKEFRDIKRVYVLDRDLNNPEYFDQVGTRMAYVGGLSFSYQPPHQIWLSSEDISGEAKQFNSRTLDEWLGKK